MDLGAKHQDSDADAAVGLRHSSKKGNDERASFDEHGASECLQLSQAGQDFVRSAGEIKMELIKLRFDKKFKLPLVKIAKDSGCSVHQICSAMKMEASETIQRRIDAYLDAKKLHVPEKMSKTIWNLEQMSRELWREYQANTIPMRDVMNLAVEHQKRLAVAMDYRLKKLLYEKIEGEFKIRVSFHDGETYWHYKSRVLARQGVVVEKRKPYSGKRAGAVGQV